MAKIVKFQSTNNVISPTIINQLIEPKKIALMA